MDNPTQTASIATDGNSEAKAVPQATTSEADIIAVKAGSAKKMEEQQKQHSSDMESLQQKLSEAQNRLAQAEAKAKTLEEKVSTSAVLQEELPKVKAAHEAAQKQLSELSSKLLAARTKLIATSFGVPETTVADKCKTVEQLDNFEEALKIVTAAKGGTGNYALGGSGAGATPTTPLDRAKQILSKAQTAKSS